MELSVKTERKKERKGPKTNGKEGIHTFESTQKEGRAERETYINDLQPIFHNSEFKTTRRSCMNKNSTVKEMYNYCFQES